MSICSCPRRTSCTRRASRSSSFENWKSPRSCLSTSNWIIASRPRSAARRPNRAISNCSLGMRRGRRTGSRYVFRGQSAPALSCWTRRGGAYGLTGARLGRFANDRMVAPPRRIPRPHRSRRQGSNRASRRASLFRGAVSPARCAGRFGREPPGWPLGAGERGDSAD